MELLTSLPEQTSSCLDADLEVLLIFDLFREHWRNSLKSLNYGNNIKQW